MGEDDIIRTFVTALIVILKLHNHGAQRGIWPVQNRVIPALSVAVCCFSKE